MTTTPQALSAVRTKDALAAKTALARRPRRFRTSNVLIMGFLFVISIYFLLPVYWMVISSTKTSGDLFGSNGLWFASNFNLFNNLSNVFTYNGGAYGLWLLNSFIYSGVSATTGTLFSAMAGYALAKFVFRGRNLIFSIILGAILVPAPALVLPLYLLMSGQLFSPVSSAPLGSISRASTPKDQYRMPCWMQHVLMVRASSAPSGRLYYVLWHLPW